MAFQVFPYRDEEPRAGKQAVPRPTVDLLLSHYHDEIRVRALVDTGAPFCIFSRAVAEALAIDMGLGRGDDRRIRILGGEHDSRLAMVHLELPPFDGLTWETECAFLYADLELSFAGVLGQQGFLDRWIASFNFYDRYFVIEERDDFVQRLGVDPTDVIHSHFDSEWDRPTEN